MPYTHQKHYASLSRFALGLPKLRIQPRTERAKPHILAHVVTTHEAAAMLDCFPGEIERLIENHTLVNTFAKTKNGLKNYRILGIFRASKWLKSTLAKVLLVGRHIKTARGRMWIVCAACFAELYACSFEEQQAIIKQAVPDIAEIEDYLDEEDN